MERKNDWIAALINRPDFTMVDMYANDIKPENTGLQDKDYYKEIPQVKEKFTNEQGKFDENKYNEFYDSALRMYNAYTDGDFIDKMVNNIERSPFDWTKINNPNVQDVSAVISTSKDPYRHSMGLRNLYDIGDPQFSLKEVAEANFVRDENGNVLDWTPNDKGGLIKGLFRPTLVLAQYEQDTEEIDEFGNIIIHKAGDYKFDKDGNPYAELLGNRDSYGKQLIGYSDTFTVEGTKLNKWDPFDSDGIDKSIGSTLAKTTLKLTPFLLGPTVGAVAGTAYAILGLASVFPVMGKMIYGIFSDNNDQFGRSLTKWESYMRRFESSKSERGQNSFWSFENIADVIASSASQLYSQRQIANIPKWLSKGKETIGNSKLGQKIALGYMAATSAQDTYSAYIEAGANEETAGIASLATMGAFYGLMNIDYWKRHFFGGSWLDENATMYRRTMEEWNKQQVAKLNALNPDMSPIKWYKKVYNKTTDFLKGNKVLNSAKEKINKLVKNSEQETKKSSKSFIASASDYFRTGLNEGLEETMEEATTDLIKGMVLGLEALNVNVNNGQEIDFGFSAKDFLARYTTSFLGGAIGGSTFEFLKKWNNRFGPKTITLLDKDTKERLIWLQLNGYGDQMRDWVERQYRRGNLGNENLSTEKSDPTNNNSPFKPGTKENNQNLLMRNVLLQTLDEIQYDIDNFAGTISMSDLYKSAVEKSEEKAKELGLSLEEYTQKEKISPFVNTLLGMGVTDNIMDDFVDITERIIDISNKIKKAEEEESSKTIDSDPNHSTSNQYIRKLIKQRDELIKQATDIKNGENLDQYLEQVFFYVSPGLSNFYINPTFGEESNPEKSYIHTNVQAYTKWKYDLNYNELSKTIQNQLNEEFEEFKVSQRIPKVRLAQRIHSTTSKQFKSTLESLNTELKGYKSNTFFGSSTLGEFIQSRIEQITDSNKIIKNQLRKIEIENEDYSNDPTWKSLNDKFTENNNRLIQYSTINEDSLSRIRLDKINSDLFNREESQDISFLNQVDILSQDIFNRQENQILTDEEKILLIDSVKDYYQYLIDNKIINTSEDPLNNALKLVFLNNLTSLNYLKNINIQEATQKYVTDDFNLTKDQLQILWELDEDKNYDTFEEEIQNNPDYFPMDFARIIDFMSLEQMDRFFGKDSILVQYAKADEKDKTNTKLGKVINKLEALGLVLQNNPFDFKRKYDEISSNLTESNITENEWKDFVINYLFGSNNELFNELLNLIDLRNQSKTISAYNLIKNIELQINGQNSALWDILQREEQDLYSKKSIQDYITNDFSKNALQYGLQIVNLLIPQVSAAVDGGFNFLLNEEKSKLKKELLPILDNNTANIILNELEYIASKLRFLLHLANTNQDSQWKEQQDSAINVQPKYLSKLIEYSEQIETQTNGKIKLKDIWDQIKSDYSFDLDNITDQTYKLFEEAKIKFESEVFNKVNQDSETRQLFKDAIINIFGSGSLGIGHSEYSKTLNKDDITSWDIFEYLTSIGFTDTKHFLGLYKTIISSNDNSYIPFPGQEFIVRQMYAHTTNLQDYRDIINQINEKFSLRQEVKNDLYLKDRSVLDSFLFVDGNSAVGKSSAISYTFKKLLELEFGTDVQFRGLARFDSRFKNLKDNLHLIEDSDVKKLDELIKDLWPDEDGPLDVDDDRFFDVGKNEKIANGHRIKLKNKTVLNKDKFFNGGKYKVLIFDEVTLANEAELQILNQWATDNNIFIIGLGNKKQNAWQTRIKVYNEDGTPQLDKNGKQIYSKSNSNIEDCIVLSTPILKASLRTQNEGKRRNKNIVETVTTELLNQLDKNPGLTLKQIVYDAKSHPISLLYYNEVIDDIPVYYGEQFVSDDSILTKLKEIKEKKPNTSILIISDYPQNYSAYKDLGFMVTDPDSAQGDEADYVFIDHDFLNKKTVGQEKSALLFFRDFYTMITRSKQASFIKINDSKQVDENFLELYNIKNVEDHIAKSKILGVTENKDILDKFKSWRLDLLKDIPEIKPTITTETNLYTEEPKPREEISEKIDVILPPKEVKQDVIKNDKENWITAVQNGIIRDDNAKDFIKRNELRNQTQNIDVNDFINKVNTENTYLKYNSLQTIDTEFDTETYRTFISYLSLGITRYLYDLKNKKDETEFDAKYLYRYIPNVNEISFNKIQEAINKSINASNMNFIMYPDKNSDSSTVFISIEVDNKLHVLPIFQVNNKLEGFISKDFIVIDPNNSINSIAISSSGNTFIPLATAAKNKAFVLNDALLFKPSKDLACTINNNYFRRRNAGTSNKMILDTPIAIGEDDSEIKSRFHITIKDNIVDSFVNTRDARLIRANVRAKDFKVFWDLVKAKFVIERGYELDDLSTEQADTLLQSQYGDIINELHFTQSIDKNENAQNSSENNTIRKGNYRILNNNSLNSVTSAILNWFILHENDEKINNTWNQLLLDYLKSDVSQEYDSGYKYQNSLFFGFRTINGTYSNYILRANNHSEEKTTYVLTTNNPEEILLEFEINDETELSPSKFFELFLNKCKEVNIPIEGYTDKGELVTFDSKNIQDYLNNRSLIFGLYKRGIKELDKKETLNSEVKEKTDVYFLPYDTDLLEIFKTDKKIDSELLASFNESTKLFKPFQYGIFLNVASKNAVPTDNPDIEQPWYIISSNNNDKFVTDIVDVIAPLYKVEINVNAISLEPINKTENTIWSLITGKEIVFKEKIESDELIIGEDLKYNKTTAIFKDLDGNNLNYLGKIKKDDNWEYYLTNDWGSVRTILVSSENNSKIEKSLNKNYPKQNLIGYTENEEFANGVIYEENGEYYYYETSKKLTIDPNTIGTKVIQINKNGKTSFLWNNTELNNIHVIVSFNTDIQTNKENYYYDTGNKIRFDSPLKISKMFLERYTETKLDNINEDYITIDSISKDNLITTVDNILIKIKDFKKFLDDLSNNYQIKNNPKTLFNKLSKYTNDNNILNEINNLLNNNNLSEINTFLDDHKYEIGLKLILDSDWNITTSISDDVIANYLARKLPLKNQIKFVYLEHNDGANKKIRVILNDDLEKTYQFKTNDFNFKNSQYYKSLWTYKEINNVENSESFTNDTFEQINKELDDEILFKTGDAQDIRTYLKLLINRSPEVKKYRKIIKDLLISYKNGTTEQQIVYQKYDEYMNRIRKINDSNNKQC